MKKHPSAGLATEQAARARIKRLLDAVDAEPQQPAQRPASLRRPTKQKAA